jgi:hypothetical protein
MARGNWHFNLKPRFGCGSPGAVWNEKLAQRVAQEERTSYEHALTGAYGAEDLEKAQKLGLEGIVEVVFEKAGGWMCQDLITGRVYRRERKAAKKLQAREVVLRYYDLRHEAVEGRFRIRTVRVPSDHKRYVIVEFEGRAEREFIEYHGEVTAEHDLPDTPKFFEA